MPPIAEEDKNLVMHVVLPLLGRHELMGTNTPESLGFTVNMSNKVYINLEPDTGAEVQAYSKHFREAEQWGWT
jgi:PhnB protein